MNKEVILKPGRYFIGDPCYVFSDPDWDKLTRKYFEGLITFKGLDLFMCGTAHGDGAYPDKEFKYNFGVDSGTLGAVPEALWSVPESEFKEYGLIKEFTEPFVCNCEEGYFTFGDIVEIDTDDDDYD
jgi:hypothetical protein